MASQTHKLLGVGSHVYLVIAAILDAFPTLIVSAIYWSENINCHQYIFFSIKLIKMSGQWKFGTTSINVWVNSNCDYALPLDEPLGFDQSWIPHRREFDTKTFPNFWAFDWLVLWSKYIMYIYLQQVLHTFFLFYNPDIFDIFLITRCILYKKLKQINCLYW